MNCYKSFCSVSKFLITNTTFFSIMKYFSIIHLVSITYLTLVHNYNTIKYICFINSRQRVGIEYIKKTQMQFFIVNWALRNYYQIPEIIGLCGYLENLKLFFSLENCQDDLHSLNTTSACHFANTSFLSLNSEF